MSLGYILRTGFLTSKRLSLLHTDTDNAHTDNATKWYLAHQITRGRAEKRGARSRGASDTCMGDGPSFVARRELLEDMQFAAPAAGTLENQLQAPGAVGSNVCSEKLRCQLQPAPRNEPVSRLPQFTENALRMVCLWVIRA